MGQISRKVRKYVFIGLGFFALGQPEKILMVRKPKNKKREQEEV
jgi:hypothetical protein